MFPSSSSRSTLFPLSLLLFFSFSCSNPSEKSTEGASTEKAEKRKGQSWVLRQEVKKDSGDQRKCDERPREAPNGKAPGSSSQGEQSELARKAASGKVSSSSIPSTRSPSLRNSFPEEPETFHIPENEKQTLVCQGGTRIHIPSGSLEKVNGEKIYAQHIRVEVKEHLSNAEMLKADLGTRSGDRLLRTKGMLHIEAEADGVPCRIKDGRSIGVSFPDPAWESGMKLFKGDRGPLGKMDWELEDTAVKVRKPEYSPVTNDRKPRMKGGNMNLKIFLLKEGEYPMKAARKGLEGKVVTELTITKKGEVRDIEVKESPAPMLARWAEQTLHKMPDWTPARFGKVNTELRIELPIRFSLGEKARQRKVFLAKGYDPEQAMERKAREFSFRMYPSERLGWINCDAFRNEEELISQKVQLERKDIGLRLLFKDRRSLLRSHRSEKDPSLHLLKNVPKGKKVQLIAIGKEGDRFRWASAEMKLGGELPELDYEVLSKADMEERMQALNENSKKAS